MSAVVRFDGNTGEVIDDSLPVPVFVIPADKDEMVADCNQSQRAAFGHHWRTAFVEKLHANWPTDRDYMAPPTRGTLATL